MKNAFQRLIGVLLLIGALVGLFFSIYGLVALRQSKAAVKEQLTTDAALVSEALRTTFEGLQVIASTLSGARSNLALIQESTRKLATALQETGPTMRTTTDLIGKDMPDVIANTRRSLAAAEDSARLVDDTLRVISAIPLIGARYKPEVPLQTSIAQVSESLKGLPASFQVISKGLDTTTANMNTIQLSVAALGDEYDKIDASLTEAQDVNARYQKIVGNLLPQADQIGQRMAAWVDNAYRIAALVLVWVILTQIAIFAQAVDWLTKRESGG